MRIALAQYSVLRGDPEANLDKIADYFARASAAKAEVLFLPEMCTTGFDWARNRELLDSAEGALDRVRCLARERGIALCGSFLEKTEQGKPANTFYFVSRSGEVLAKYRKIHLFTLFHEEVHVEPGNRIVCAETNLGRIGCAVCYDLRFPELFRKNTLAGAGVHILPAAFPHPRLDHWRTLVCARAVENQSFFIATNQCGFEGHGSDVGRTQYFGHSMVVDPWGEILLEAGEGEALSVIDLSLEKVDSIRNYLTALRDRRPDLY